GVLVHYRAVRPAGADQVAPSHRLPRAGEQAGEQSELGWGQRGRARAGGDRVRDRVETEAGGLDRTVGAAAASECVQPSHDLDERERLRDVVVAAGVEAGEAVGKLVPRSQEQQRRLDAARPQRLAEVAAVGVGQADVDDEQVRRYGIDAGEQVGPGRDRLRLEPLLGQTALQHATQLGIVLGDQHAGSRHSSRSIAPSGIRLIPAAATTAAIAPPATAAAARPPRNGQGAARWSGGGSNTCCSIATSISASSQPSNAASASAAPSTSAVSVQRKAAISLRPAPSAAMVANSCRRSASATATKSAMAAAASARAKLSSIRLMPPRSTVVIELTVCAVCWRMFFTSVPCARVCAATSLEAATGSPLALTKRTFGPGS